MPKNSSTYTVYCVQKHLNSETVILVHFTPWVPRELKSMSLRSRDLRDQSLLLILFSNTIYNSHGLGSRYVWQHCLAEIPVLSFFICHFFREGIKYIMYVPFRICGFLKKCWASDCPLICSTQQFYFHTVHWHLFGMRICVLHICTYCIVTDVSKENVLRWNCASLVMSSMHRSTTLLCIFCSNQLQEWILAV